MWVQITVAMGRAADNSELLMQPYQMLELMPLLADLYHEGSLRGLLLQPGNNIGYFGPYEHVLRGSGEEAIHWTSCVAGRNAIGIEADGTIKGCPSLATASFAGGNIRQTTLVDIWNTPELSFARDQTTDDLWGFCRTCYYADICQGGCTWTADSLFGRRGNNPYCHHRALELDKRGLRERVLRVEEPPGLPFDRGKFDLILETLDSHCVTATFESEHHSIPAQKSPGAKLSFLEICRGCNRHVYPNTERCPHCGGLIAALSAKYAYHLAVAKQAQRRLIKLLENNGADDLLKQRRTTLTKSDENVDTTISESRTEDGGHGLSLPVKQRSCFDKRGLYAVGPHPC